MTHVVFLRGVNVGATVVSVPGANAAAAIDDAPRGEWLPSALARDGRFAIGEYRGQMKVIGYLGTLHCVFGAPATTRNWNTRCQSPRHWSARCARPR
jgi:hypothetical protein